MYIIRIWYLNKPECIKNINFVFNDWVASINYQKKNRALLSKYLLLFLKKIGNLNFFATKAE